jgi:hypothetical protein
VSGTEYQPAGLPAGTVVLPIRSGPLVIHAITLRDVPACRYIQAVAL